MKKFLSIITFLVVVFMMGCCVNTTVRHPEPRATLPEELAFDTVALSAIDNDGDTVAYCSGVWVGVDEILTANHCIRSQIDNIVAMVDEDEKLSKEERDRLAEKMEDNFELHYFVKSDSVGVYRDPIVTYDGKVSKHDKLHDLALIKVDPKNHPRHGVATLALSTPLIGEDLHVMGHPSSLVWTYTKCVVSAYREENFRPAMKHSRGPWLQVAGEVWNGNSGGGVFNNNRQLVGIASFIAPAPNEGFFVHLNTIKAFLSVKQ